MFERGGGSRTTREAAGGGTPSDIGSAPPRRSLLASLPGRLLVPLHHLGDRMGL